MLVTASPNQDGEILTPAPRLVAAQYVLGQVHWERVPWWAAQWLADGQDGPALRELAGLNSRDPHAVRDLLPQALTEMSVPIPAATVAAAAETFDHLARMGLSGAAAERWVAQKVEELIANTNYDDEIMGLPLGGLYGVVDAWVGGWGPSEDVLKAQVRAACIEQIKSRLDAP